MGPLVGPPCRHGERVDNAVPDGGLVEMDNFLVLLGAAWRKVV